MHRPSMYLITSGFSQLRIDESGRAHTRTIRCANKLSFAARLKNSIINRERFRCEFTYIVLEMPTCMSILQEIVKHTNNNILNYILMINSTVVRS